MQSRTETIEYPEEKKIDELNKMKYVLQNAKENKQSESYPRVFSENIDYLKTERGKKKRTLSAKKRNERRRKMDVTKTGNGERGAGNGERKSGNELSAETSIKIQNGR